MNSFNRLDQTLKQQANGFNTDKASSLAKASAEAISITENALVVLSDLFLNKSYIFAGKFARQFGIAKSSENSIWEEEILCLMTDEQREAKFLAELKFYHFIRQQPPSLKKDYFLAMKLKMRTSAGAMVDVCHHMHYIFADDCHSIAYAVCIYQPDIYNISSVAEIINSVTGVRQALLPDLKINILSKRELQILNLIHAGKTSEQIASLLSISRNTVNRHRQNIISNLNVRNTTEALYVGKSLGLI